MQELYFSDLEITVHAVGVMGVNLLLFDYDDHDQCSHLR